MQSTEKDETPGTGPEDERTSATLSDDASRQTSAGADQPVSDEATPARRRALRREARQAALVAAAAEDDASQDTSTKQAGAGVSARRAARIANAQGQGAGSNTGRRSKLQVKRRQVKNNVSPPKPGAPAVPVMPPAASARTKRRHVGVLLSFLLLVIAPMAVATWYMYEKAADQYASSMGFSVRKEEGSNAAEVIGGIVDFGSATTSDTDILYEFIQSQAMVERVDQKLDLRTIYSKPEGDPVFTIDVEAPIEDLVRYWRRMVTINYDGGTGLIEIRVLAFTPEDAQLVSRTIFEESSAAINKLTTIARDDATRHARDELALAEERLKKARTSLTEFRARTQIVDPSIDVQGQMGLLTNLQAQLAAALIELDLLMDNTREGDPRVRQAEQRITVIENRIAEERKKFGVSENNVGSRDYASLVGEYESLVVDREFAEESYLAALANFDAAQAEALRQTRYLAAYSAPTLAQSSEYPQRTVLLAVLGLFLLAAWTLGVLIYYSIRDRR